MLLCAVAASRCKRAMLPKVLVAKLLYQNNVR